MPIAFHFGAAVFLAAVFSLYHLGGDADVIAMQEDGVIEWMSFLLFGVAGVGGTVHALKGRRPFDLLVGLFCLFVAGEEISWGQRIFGYMPPDFFLANNFQQEPNLHNFSGLLGQPKWVLAAALAGYALLRPAAATSGLVRRALEHVGATPPPLALVPWFAACVLLLAWYPIEYTGEWVEMLAGALFVATLATAHLVPLVLASVPVALGLAWLSATRGPSSAAQLACAAAESAALARDVVSSAGYREELIAGGSIEKRIWSAAGAGYLDWERLAEFRGVSCPGEDQSRTHARRSYGIDPWGTAYWLQTGGEEEESTVTIYSFGPNRRRDLERGDDIRAIERWDTDPRR